MSWLLDIAYAAPGLPVLDKAIDQIIKPIILLLAAAAFIIFLYGLYEMIANGDNEEARRIGQQHVLWGVVGMFIMISFYGIMHVICKTIPNAGC